MKDSQKLVFTMLAAVLLLEFGSLTKLRKVWQLAFTAGASSSTTASTTPAQQTTYTTDPTTHPSQVVSL